MIMQCKQCGLCEPEVKFHGIGERIYLCDSCWDERGQFIDKLIGDPDGNEKLKSYQDKIRMNRALIDAGLLPKTHKTTRIQE